MSLIKKKRGYSVRGQLIELVGNFGSPVTCNDVNTVHVYALNHCRGRLVCVHS